MKKLLSKTYFPFGSQYYRAPSPHRDDWERDLKNMAAYGFNTVKFWVQWRWNNPEENKFYFDDIDELMGLAQKYKLRVMLNTIFDTAPAWIYTKIPDASMITLSGRKIGPQTQPHRQIGGLGYCFNNYKVTDYQFRFLKETISRYKKHPALEIWNVGSEPELTSSMAELRLYAEDAEKMGDMLCYCENCKRKFRQWLGRKYKKIEKLNKAWNRNYKSFEETEIPLTRNTFNDIIDWRMFFVHTIRENIERRFEIAEKEDKQKHPLMCHHVFIQGFPVASTANDPWNVGKLGDLHGFTQMDDAMMIDILRSCAKGKPVISAEMLMLMGYTLDLPKFIDENDIKKLIFRGIAGNLKGFIFWQYRPEILGREAPAWGLTYLDGSETPWLRSFSKVGKVLQKHADFLLEAKPVKAEAAILYNPENQIFAWASTGSEMTATNSLLGVHRALYEKNFNIDFIHPSEIEKNILENYKVLYIPSPYFLSVEICAALEKWVKNGGVLIGESYFAGWNKEHGHHEKIVPGYGLHKVFKARQGVVQPANKNNIINIQIFKDRSDKKEEAKITDSYETELFRIKSGAIESLFNSKVEIEILKDLPYIKKGSKVSGVIVKETLITEGAEILARFDTGEPAITTADYGKGKAILIGSYIGLHYYYCNNEANGNLIAGLVEMNSNIIRPAAAGSEKIRIDCLARKNELMVIVHNLSSQSQNAFMKFPSKKPRLLKEQFTGEKLEINADTSGGGTEIKLDPKEVKIFYG
ncbi:MAG: beta-galactosidase [Ignavibacteria bacterium]